MNCPKDYNCRIKGYGDYGRLITIIRKVDYLVENGNSLNSGQKNALEAIRRFLIEVRYNI